MPEAVDNPTVGQEFGRAGRNILNKYGGFGENPDKVIATKGMAYIKDIERDPHLASSLATRRAKSVKRGWRIVPASQDPIDLERADFVRTQLMDMAGSVEKDIEGMLDAISKGFSLTEINYRWVDWRGRMLVGLDSLRYKDPEWFAFKFDDFGYFRINQIDPDANGVELPGEKFIHIINGYNDENPYGQSVTAEVAFWVWVKKNISKFWSIYAEKFGMPLSKVVIPRNATASDLTKIDDIMNSIQEETGIRVPEGFDITFLEATRSGEANYERFIEICNKEISKRVFGATLISEEGKRGQGSYALGSEHSGIFEDYVLFDAVVLQTALSEQLVLPLVRFNWSDVLVFPKFEFIEFDQAAFITFSQAIGNLINAGLKISEKWVYDKLKIPLPTVGESVLEPAQGNGMSAFPGTEDAPVKPDNRVKMAEKTPEGADFTNIDRITERYRTLLAAEWEQLAAAVKKKSLAAPGSCCNT